MLPLPFPVSFFLSIYLKWQSSDPCCPHWFSSVHYTFIKDLLCDNGQDKHRENQDVDPVLKCYPVKFSTELQQGGIVNFYGGWGLVSPNNLARQ